MTEKNTSGHYQKITSYFLGFISFILFVYILIALKSILIPVTIAVFMTFLFHPVLEYLSKFKIPKGISLIMILLGIIGASYLVVVMVEANSQAFAGKYNFYAENFNKAVTSILAVFNLDTNQLAVMLHFKSGRFTFNEIAESLLNSGVIPQIFSSVTSVVEDFFITLLFWCLMIMGKEKFENRLKSAFEEKDEFISDNIQAIDTQLQNYIFIKTVLSILVGLVTSLVLWILGVDFPVIWGVIAFILNYIPSIGAIISIIFPVAIALLQYGIGIRAILAGVILFVIHNLIGNLLEPQMMGKRMDLSPVFVLFSLFFWGWIWGIPGMFLAVPIASIIKILCSIIEPLKPLSIILGGNPENKV